jgi:hypothetical protein
MELLLFVAVLFSLLMMAFYSGLQVAFSHTNRLNVELLKKQGVEAGNQLSRYFEQPSRFVGVMTVGYYFFFVSFILLISVFWQYLLDNTSWINIVFAHNSKLPIRLFLEILIAVLAVFYLGNFLPKSICRVNADTVVLFSARSGILSLSDHLFWPVAKKIIRSGTWVLVNIFNTRVDKKKEPINRAGLDYFLQQTGEKGHGTELNTNLIEAALQLPQTKMRECLVPRKEIEAIDITATIEDARQKFVATRLSKLVVFKTNIDQIVGYIHQLDLFKNPKSIEEILLKIPAVPESMSARDLMTRLTKERKSMAWVVDEFGGTAGIVTMEDLLEELFGEIRDEYDVEELEEKVLSETEFLLSGRLELDYLREKFGLIFLDNNSETLSGYIIHQHESIPRLKEHIVLSGYEFEIIEVSSTRIEKVKLKKV